jgi:DNA-binding NarL/FixJ family response regulator
MKVLVVDDEPAVRQGLRMNLGLEGEVEIVGEAATAREALNLAWLLQPDVVVMDASLPDMEVMKVARLLRLMLPQCSVVVLTLHDNESLQAEATEAGAKVCPKHRGGKDLVACIKQDC